MEQKTVFVGLSGGVDSSVAAARLLARGYKVVGVFIKVWQPDFLDCNWEQERLDAMRVAAKLDIPFLTFDGEEAYKQQVADYFIAEYAAGRTPNPDVMCNQFVKFGAFLDFALAQGADYVATGHYARMIDVNGVPTLARGIDTNKDQSYFLWTLTKEQRGKILFPVGDSTKEVIRSEAEQAGLITATKKDSQGICFLGQVDIPEFLSHFITLIPGDVLDTDGNKIGRHQGSLVYTIGQRHGFSVTANNPEQKPFYIQSKNIENNTITVSTERPTTDTGTVTLDAVNEILPFSEYSQAQAQFRYRQTPFPVNLTKDERGHGILEVLTEIETPSVGQSCVLYADDICIGGGIITHTHAGN